MRALAKLSWVEIKLFSREPLTVMFTFALPLVFLFVLAGVFGNEPDTADEGEIAWRGVGPIDYYVPAYVGLVIAAIGLIAVPVHMAMYRERGVLRRLRASSISLWTVLGSQVVVSVVTATLSGMILAIAAFAAYDVAVPDSPARLLLAFSVCAISFSALGVLLGAVMPSARAAQGAGVLLFFVMLMIAGAGPPREVMSDAMQVIGDLMPLRYVIVVLQNPWLGFGWDVYAYAIVIGILLTASAMSALLFRWE